jgi:DNA repair protein RecO (recombination protein O)
MMAKNPRDLRTEAIVLRRTDYGEADRILQLLTPEGKRSVIARGVRKEKSKLAGGIELFSVSEVVIHEGRTEMGILTGAKLLEYYDAFVKDIELIEMGGNMMRSVSMRAEQVESPEFYKILKQSLQAMQKHANEETRWKDVLRAWWGINLTRASGEELNLNFDTDGEKLVADGRYYWDEENAALGKANAGRLGADHIKMMRIMQAMPVEVALKIQGAEKLIDEVLYVARCAEKVTKI